MIPGDGKVNLPALSRRMKTIIQHVLAQEAQHELTLQQVDPTNLQSARNLVHYLAMRCFDLRPIQDQLAMLGISAIAHSEGYTLANLLNIYHLLELLQGQSTADGVPREQGPPLNYMQSRQKLLTHTRELFGDGRPDTQSRIMVTMPSEASHDYELLRDLMLAGMDIARINCSHDDPERWEAMIHNIRRAEAETGRSCKVCMDLGGPKLRTDFPPPPGQEEKKKPGLRLFPGDRIKVCRHRVSNVTPTRPNAPFVARISASLDSIFEDVQIGQRVFFDDGKIGGRIAEVLEDGFMVVVEETGLSGTKLRSDKGINLPDTELSTPSLTRDDLANLPFIARHADMVGYSFVRKPGDVEQLQEELRRLGREDMGILLQLETKDTFDHMPEILLTAMRSPHVGVMIARGDLAVEIGFERIAEVQEELLWLCEAAQLPGIWATQVLEKLAKKGQASRAEITDAAMSGRAECVMLNKGPYIVKAVETLADILTRMQAHQVKRKASLRPLRVARHFAPSGEEPQNAT